MKKLLCTTLTLLLAQGYAVAQLARIHTSPLTPQNQELAPYNLVKAWHAHLPMDGVRDGFFSMQIHDNQLIVLLRSGALICINPATGETLWRNRVGVPYVPPAGFGSNSKLVFVAKGVDIYALDRKTGRLLWDFQMPNAPSAAPVADDERLFLPVGVNRLQSYFLPLPNGTRKPAAEAEPVEPTRASARGSERGYVSAFGVSGQRVESVSAVSSKGQAVRAIGPLSTAAQASRIEKSGPQPEFIWDFMTETRPETRIEQPSVLTSDLMLQAGANGLYFTVSKYEPRVFYRYQADAPVSAPIGSYGEIAYVASEDFRVYALDIVSGKVLWRFVSGGPIRQKPRTTDDSVYVTADRAGLYRLNRETGDIVWNNGSADRYVAVNRSILYARDTSGRLLLLDRGTGRLLATYDGARQFVVPLSNELNDRIYLASNNGLLVCLHDRDYQQPFKTKNDVMRKPSRTREDAMKPEEKKPSSGPATRPANRPRPAAESKESN